MKCHQFRRDLPDWLRGDMTDTDQSAMKTHVSDCRECAREEAMERHLRGAWKSIADPAAAPEMWPRVAAALDRKPAQPKLGPARWALGTAFALGALCAVLWTQSIDPEIEKRGPDLVSAREEQNVVQMVSELRQLPDLDRERSTLEPPHLRHAAVFLGEPEGR